MTRLVAIHNTVLSTYRTGIACLPIVCEITIFNHSRSRLHHSHGCALFTLAAFENRADSGDIRVHSVDIATMHVFVGLEHRIQNSQVALQRGNDGACMWLTNNSAKR